MISEVLLDALKIKLRTITTPELVLLAEVAFNVTMTDFQAGDLLQNGLHHFPEWKSIYGVFHKQILSDWRYKLSLKTGVGADIIVWSNNQTSLARTRNVWFHNFQVTPWDLLGKFDGIALEEIQNITKGW